MHFTQGFFQSRLLNYDKIFYSKPAFQKTQVLVPIPCCCQNFTQAKCKYCASLMEEKRDSNLGALILSTIGGFEKSKVYTIFLLLIIFFRFFERRTNPLLKSTDKIRYCYLSKILYFSIHSFFVRTILQKHSTQIPAKIRTSRTNGG